MQEVQGIQLSLGDMFQPVKGCLERLTQERVLRRIWSRDHTVWSPDPEEITDRLGWLEMPRLMRHQLGEFEALADDAKDFTTAVLLGMGGSSLAAEVLREILGVRGDGLDLLILDSTHPATIASLEEDLQLDRTLFIVASKSGTTVETLSHFAYFYEKIQSGDQFVAITDPGTSLADLARDKKFRRVFLNPEDVGGRYSALSYFGLVPAALIGADIGVLLERAVEAASVCNGFSPTSECAGAWLGSLIGEAARAGHDKLTFVLPSAVASFGAWLEQLVAESTGKKGRGVVPVVGEPLGPPHVYGSDRLIVAWGEDPALDDLVEAGVPAARLAPLHSTELGKAFFDWELATAVVGKVVGVNPFDQPDVVATKQATKEALDRGVIEEAATPSIDDVLQQVRPGDYVGIQAFLQRTAEVEGQLERVRVAIRDHYRVATTVDFGPRFLHSTGQLHKGGPNTGVFIQVVDEKRDLDLAVPGQDYTFGELIDAQALGDFNALSRRGRRVARASYEEISRWEIDAP